MNKYFIYYSATGNGDMIAEKLKDKGYTPVKIEMVKPIGKMNFFKILKYGGQAMSNKKAKIMPVDLHLENDDKVIIGSPIWNDRLSTPINTILAMYDFNKDTTMFILYPAGNGTKKSLIQIEKIGFKLSPLVITYPLKNEDKVDEALGGIE